MTPEERAAGKMQVVLRRTLDRYPFHANIVAAGVFIAERVGTMAVTVRDGRLTFLYDVDFVLAQELDVLVGGLLHEVLHVVFDHLTADPAAYPDRRARTISEEVTVNEAIAEPLPDGVLRIEQFGLLPDETTDERYERLKGQDQNQQPSDQKAGARNEKSDPGAPNPAPDVPDSPAPGTFDDHTVWEEARVHAADSTAVVQDALRDAVTDTPDEVLAALPASIRSRIQDLLPAARSTDPTEEQIARGGVARIPWREVLDVGGRAVAVPNLRRPSRRFSDLIGIVPSYPYRPSRRHVVAVIDSSGSMTAALLAAVSSELSAIARLHNVTVVECDDHVRAVARYTGPLTSVHGRGGTDLRPPLARALLTKLRPDVVVFFTDGQGPAPSSPPAVPVVWALTKDGRRPARWGRVVRIGA